MRRLLIGIAASSIGVAACSAPTPSPSNSTPPSAASTPAAAPPQATPAAGGGEEKEGSKTEEGHEHEAPHGGTLVELGEEFAHVELLLEASTGTLTAYALDGEAERAVRLPQSSIALSVVTGGGKPIDVTLAGVANPLTGETAADTSQFRAVVPLLKGAAEFEGSIKTVTVRGQQFQNVSFRYPSAEHE